MRCSIYGYLKAWDFCEYNHVLVFYARLFRWTHYWFWKDNIAVQLYNEVLVTENE